MPSFYVTQTSKAAAKVALSKSALIAQAIFNYAKIQGSQGVTADEVISDLSVRESTITARMRGLKDSGLLIPNSQTRVTRTGCKADVFVVPDGADFASYSERKAQRKSRSDRKLVVDTMSAVRALVDAHRQGSAIEREKTLKDLLALHGVRKLPLFSVS